jgi:hypothetical protein
VSPDTVEKKLFPNINLQSFFLGVLFNLEDGGDIFLQNVSRISMDYMA